MNKNVELMAIENKSNDVFVKLGTALKNLQEVLNRTAGEEKQGKVKLVVDSAYKGAEKALSEYNKLLDKAYYLSHNLMDVVKAGKEVPAYTLEVVNNEETGAYTVSITPVKVYPNMKRMDVSKVLPEHTIDKVDLLRREVAYLRSNKNRVFLTGDVDGGKEVPNDYVAKLIEEEGDISVNKVKVTLSVVLKEITGGEFKKEVFTKLYKDFESFMVKRTGEWGERTMVSRSVACDLVLEYAHLYFNNARDVKWTLC